MAEGAGRVMAEPADFLAGISEIERVTAEVGIEAKRFTGFLVLDILFVLFE